MLFVVSNFDGEIRGTVFIHAMGRNYIQYKRLQSSCFPRREVQRRDKSIAETRFQRSTSMSTVSVKII